MNAFSAMIWDANAADSRLYTPAGMPNWRKAIRYAEALDEVERVNALTVQLLVSELDQQIYEATS